MAACRSVNGVLQKQLTEEKNSKEEILRQRDRLSQVIKSMLLLIFVFDTRRHEERPAFMSDRYRKSELLGKHNSIQFYFSLYISDVNT